MVRFYETLVSQKNNLDKYKFVFVRVAFVMIFGYLLAKTVVFDSLLPFGVSLVCALPVQYIFAGLAGVIFGSVLPANLGLVAYYVGMPFVASLIKFVLLQIFSKKNSVFFSLLSCAVAYIFGLISLVLSGSDALSLGTLAEALLSISATYFFNKTSSVIFSTKKIHKLSFPRMCACVLTFGCLLVSISSFTFFTLSFSNIFAVVIVLISAHYGGLSHALACSISFGFALSVGTPSALYILGAFAFGGMLSGLFSGGGKIGVSLGFLLGSSCVFIGFFSTFDTSAHYVEFLIAFVIFMFIPKSFSSFFLDVFSPCATVVKLDLLRKNLTMRLKFSSHALGSISQTLDEFGEKSRAHAQGEVHTICKQTASEFCTDCGLYSHCFGVRKGETFEAFCSCLDSKKDNDNNNIWSEFSKRCLAPEKIQKSLLQKNTALQKRLEAERDAQKIRSAICEQMNGLSNMLYDMALEFYETERIDSETAARVDTVLRALGIAATNICCKINRARRMQIEIIARRQAKSVPKLELMNRLSALLNITFEAPVVTNVAENCFITLTEKPSFSVQSALCQINKKGEQVCGDSCLSFCDGKGNFITLLSDGMGSGKAAAIDSKFCSELMKKLILAGFGYECALKFVNTAMMFKSGDERSATVDVCCIDLYTGQADFYKAGAPKTFVLKGKRLGNASCTSFPVGILNDASFDKTSTYLSKGNVIVMLSDGVDVGEDDWLEKEIVNARRCSAQVIADRIAERAIANSGDKSDDITVAVMIIDEAF